MNGSFLNLGLFMKTVFQKIFFLIVAAFFIAGCASERPVNVAPSVATGDDLYFGAPTQAPPKDQKDVVPPPPGLAAHWWFIPGRWEWRGKWVWTAGYWRPRPHSGDYWLGGQWEQQTNSTLQTNVYVWKRGHWHSGSHDGDESNESR